MWVGLVGQKLVKNLGSATSEKEEKWTKNTSLTIASIWIKHAEFCFNRPKSSSVLGCIIYWDAEQQRKQDRKLRQWDKAPYKSTNNPANMPTTGTRRLNSYPFYSISVPSSTTREYPFPSGQPRGKEAGNVAVFGALLSVCEYLHISHQWGKLQHFFLFLPPHDTQPVFFGSHTPQILAAKFLATHLMWLCNTSVISTRA